jgi:hypothetical protein
MYATDLPKWDSTLPEAASERDQHSPHHRIASLAVQARSCTIVAQIRPVPHNLGLLTPSYDVWRASDPPYTHLQRMRLVLPERIEIGRFVKIFNQRFQLNQTKTSKLVVVFGGSRGRRPQMRIWIKGMCVCVCCVVWNPKLTSFLVYSFNQRCQPKTKIPVPSKSVSPFPFRSRFR